MAKIMFDFGCLLCHSKMVKNEEREPAPQWRHTTEHSSGLIDSFDSFLFWNASRSTDGTGRGGLSCRKLGLAIFVAVAWVCQDSRPLTIESEIFLPYGAYDVIHPFE